jgi:probable HAF family extracellular repeat protein
MTKIPSLGGHPTFVNGVNNHGEVTGASTTSDRQVHAFLWTRSGGIQDLGSVSGTSWGSAINNNGQITGWFGQAGSEQMFLWSRESGMQDLHVTAIPADINDVGQIVGYYNNAQPHAFLWSQAAGLQDLGTLGGCCSKAIGINNNGQVVGWSYTSAGAPPHPFLWTPDRGMQDLNFDGQAFAINNTGQVVGEHFIGANHVAFLWSETTGLEDLGTLNGTDSAACDINDNGLVLGVSGHSFLWTQASGMQDLDTLLGGQVLELGSCGNLTINNAGQIASVPELANGVQASAIFSPIINVTLSSSPNPSYVGQAFTLTATASSIVGPPPDGENLNFFSGTVLLGAVPMRAGAAQFDSFGSKATKIGFRSRYPGDLNYYPSKPTSLTQAVNRWPTTIALRSDNTSSNYGKAVTLTAQVNTSGPDGLTGNVVFESGATRLGSRVPSATGIAMWTTTKLPLGIDAVTATYSDDPSNAQSTSAVLMQRVNQATTTMTLTSSPNPSLPGRSVTFRATLTSNGGLPVGSMVTFTMGGVTLGTSPIGASGVAVLSTTALPEGSDKVTATYAGDANYTAAQASVVQIVK